MKIDNHNPSIGQYEVKISSALSFHIPRDLDTSTIRRQKNKPSFLPSHRENLNWSKNPCLSCLRHPWNDSNILEVVYGYMTDGLKTEKAYITTPCSASRRSLIKKKKRSPLGNELKGHTRGTDLILAVLVKVSWQTPTPTHTQREREKERCMTYYFKWPKCQDKNEDNNTAWKKETKEKKTKISLPRLPPFW